MNSEAHETLAGQSIEVVMIEWKKPLDVVGDEGWCTKWRYKTVMKVNGDIWILRNVGRGIDQLILVMKTFRVWEP